MGETARTVTEVLGAAAHDRAAVQPQEIPPAERYIVLGELGRGGMGVVHRAYDRLLCREVALKSVTIDLASPQTSSSIVDEARAMAMLNHPNVVAVYDVNVSGGSVVLVMEYVPGTTLTQWLEQHRSDRRSILRTFKEAGRGLAAAHASGLLHRDFKPANVLIDDEGRVRVTDFGLACVAGTMDEREVLLREGHSTGPLGGTPRYMAPEQHLLEPLSTATDQYAFCLALWEALTNQEVFSRDGATDVAEKLGGPPPWPREVSVSSRVSEALRRGLAPNAADRWPSMDELLAALEEPPPHRRPWFSATAAIATLTIATAALAAREEAQPCTGAQAAIAEAWGAEQHEQVERAFSQSGAPYAPEAAQQARRELDRYASTWVGIHTRSCQATAIRGEQSSAVLDLQMGCLHRAKTELSAVAQLLSQADTKVVENAHEMVARLPSLERCADVEALQSEIEPPAPHERAAVDATRLHLAEVKALRAAGKYEQAVVAMDAVEQARAGTYYPPLQAEVHYELGRTQQLRAAYDEAETALRLALSLALQSNHHSVALAAASELTHVMSVIRGRPSAAMIYGEMARSLLTGSDSSRESEILLANRIGILLRDQGRYAEAEAEHRAALKSALELWDPGHPDVSELRVALAVVLRLEGQYEEALDQLRTALEEQQRTLGPDHPFVATIHNSLANALGAQERHEEAEHEYREAFRIWSAALGTEAMEVATVRSNLGNTLEMLGRYEEAETEIRAAMESWTAQLGPDHPYIGISHANLGHLYRDQGQLERALSEFRASQALYAAAYGPEHPHVANARAAIATILHARGQLAEAEVEARVVLELSEKAFAHIPDHPDLLTASYNLALILLSRDKVAEALPLLEKSWLGRAEQPPSATKAGIAFSLAQALVETAGDCERGRALAEQAREICMAPESGCLPEETSAVADFIRDLRCRS